MKKLFFLLALVPTFAGAHEAIFTNNSDFNIWFALHSTQIGCCCSTIPSNCGDGGPGQCDFHLKPNETQRHPGCAGACWKGVEVWYEGGQSRSGKIDYVDFGATGACQAITVIVNKDYKVFHLP